MHKRRRFRRIFDFSLIPKLLLLGVILLFFRAGMLKGTELLQEAADAQGKNLINDIISRQTQECIAEFPGDFYTLNRPGEETLVTARADVQKLNLLKARLTQRLTAELKALSRYRLTIPLGTMLGGSLLQSRGPKLPFWIEPYSTAEISFAQQLSQAGINTVHYRLSLHIKVKMTLIFPFKRKVSLTESEFLLEDRIISGRIPQTIWGGSSTK